MSTARAVAVICVIRAAQERGLQQGNRFLPPYATALAEIAAGRKESHWIWYVWPSLAAVRPNVRLPQYLLPDLATARLYIGEDDLRGRLLEISAAATAHLQAGMLPEQLFGQQHRYDAPKFHETLTAFAVAGRLCSAQHYGQEVETACLAGIAALTQGGPAPGGLHQGTVEILTGPGGGSAEEVEAVQALAATFGVAPPPQTGAPTPQKPQPKQPKQQKHKKKHKQQMAAHQDANDGTPALPLQPQQPSPLSSQETETWTVLQAQVLTASLNRAILY
jgi:uncharacterized protein (DUF1810 family)